MGFGKVWKTGQASFWDGMWRLHKDSDMTARLLDLAMEADTLCEVGCGFGHFLQVLIDRGWKGRFIGFEMSADGCEKVEQRCEAAGIECDTFSGDFLVNVNEGVKRELDDRPTTWTEAAAKKPDGETISICRGVVQHQSHWMPMTLGMLRLAPVAYVGIGYVSRSEYHEGPLRPQGHYDIAISPQLLTRETKAVGVEVLTEMFYNPARGCQEMLATFR